MKHFDNAYALIIGINHYQNINRLDKAVNDAEDLASVLVDPEACGYLRENVRLVTDNAATLVAFEREMAWLSTSTNDESTVTVFFSGHGAHDPHNSQQAFLLVHDSNPWDDGHQRIDVDRLRKTAVSAQRFTTALNEIKAQKVTIFFDACHSGGFASPRSPFFNREILKKGLSDQYYEQLKRGEGRIVIASCKPDQVSWERTAMRNGVFTTVLLAGLRGGARKNDAIGVLTLFDYLSRRVPDAVKEIVDPRTGQPAEQNPFLKAETTSDYPIALARPRVSSSTGQPTASSEAEFDIFISYSKKDSEKVIPVINRLKQDDFRVWWDHEQSGAGDVLVKQLAEGVKRCRHLLVFFSRNYLESDYAYLERAIGQALDVAAKAHRLIPVKLDDSEMPTELGHLTFADLSSIDPNVFEHEYQKAIKNVERIRLQTGPYEPDGDSSLENEDTARYGGKALAGRVGIGFPGDHGQQTQDLFEIPFENQKDALWAIEQRMNSADPFAYICAAAQTGKTYLLKEIMRRCEAGEISPNPHNKMGGPQKWCCVIVNLKTTKKTIESIDEIIAMLIQHCDMEGVTATGTDIKKCLVSQAEQSKRVLLLVNGTEYMSERVAQQFLGLLETMKSAVDSAAGYTPAVVTVGRRLFPEWERANSPMKPVDLESFTPAAVLDMLKSVRAGSDPKPLQRDDAWQKRISYHVYQCAAGHPRCIAALLHHLHEEKYTVSNPNHDDTFLAVIVPVITEHILAPSSFYNTSASNGKMVDLELLVPVFHGLSLFRIIIPDLIEFVLDQMGIVGSAETAIEIERLVEQSLLVRRDRYFGWLTMPASVRQLLSRWMSLEHAGFFEQHGQATTFFDKWIVGPDSSLGRNTVQGLSQIGFIREALFHTVLSHKGDLDRSKALKSLQEKLDKYSGKLNPRFPGDKIGRDLRHWLHNDEELRQLIDDLTHVGAYDHLIDSTRHIP